MRYARTRRLLVALMTTGTIICAPPASADPEDLVPWCSGDQTPADTNCRVDSTQVSTDSAPGADPDTPLGVNPGQDPFVGTG